MASSVMRRFAIFKALGIRAVFVGRSDELEEDTAIYQAANETRVGQHFATYEGWLSDWELGLTSAATQRRVSGKIPEKVRGRKD